MKMTLKVAAGAAIAIAGMFAFIYVALDTIVKNTGRPSRGMRD